MYGFNEIVGHQEIIRHLQSAIEAGKVSHAYIFSGEKGSGKNTLAQTFAAALLCEKKGTNPCMECPSCRKMQSHSHPDVIMVTHEKPNSIGVDDVREQLINDVAIRPYESPYKIYIVNEAEKLTLQAQNALLKTLEEPPAYVVILFLTTNIDAFLPTITSRCVNLSLRPIQEEMVKEYLMEQLHVPDYQAQVDAAFAQGNIGKARQIAQSEDFGKMTEQAFAILRRTGDLEYYELVDMIRRMTAEKQNIYEYLHMYTLWFRDVLFFKATKEIEGLIFKDQFNDIQERANTSSYEGIQKILDAIDKAEARLRANVNFDLAMELLFLTMKEN